MRRWCCRLWCSGSGSRRGCGCGSRSRCLGLRPVGEAFRSATTRLLKGVPPHMTYRALRSRSCSPNLLASASQARFLAASWFLRFASSSSTRLRDGFSSGCLGRRLCSDKLDRSFARISSRFFASASARLFPAKTSRLGLGSRGGRLALSTSPGATGLDSGSTLSSSFVARPVWSSSPASTTRVRLSATCRFPKARLASGGVASFFRQLLKKGFVGVDLTASTSAGVCWCSAKSSLASPALSVARLSALIFSESSVGVPSSAASFCRGVRFLRLLVEREALAGVLATLRSFCADAGPSPGVP
eukprot:scaffold778_cov263-Pinguiococcus_pyrenoidosus.AAC.4